MQRAHERFCVRLFSLLVTLACAATWVGCGAVEERLSGALYPSVTPAAKATSGSVVSAATVAQPPTKVNPSLTPIPPAPGATALPRPTASPTAAPRPVPPQRLVFARGGSIFRGDLLGGEAVEVALAPELEAWAFYQGNLAVARGRAVDVIDLARGSLSSFRVEGSARPDYAEAIWGSSGKTLLYVAMLPDPRAKSFGFNVELYALNPADGAKLGMAVVPDASGVTVLRYDEAQGRVVLVVLGANPAFSELRYYDLKSGKLAGTFPAKGEGEALISPDGRYLLTELFTDRGGQLALYDLMGQVGAPPRIWQHPDRTHSAAHIWSPDGRYVAYLLREGKSYAEDSQRGLGLWLLDVASMQARKVAEEAFVSSSLSAWTPDGAYIVGYHRGAGQDVHYYAVRPDGSDRRVLTIGAEAEVLGWMPDPGRGTVAKVVVDPWRARLLATAGEPAAMAEVVADYVLAQGRSDDKTLTRLVKEQLEKAGWKFDLAGPTIKRLADTTLVAQLPPLGIYVFEAGRAQAVAIGHLILDARIKGDELGLISGVIGASATQSSFVLLRRQPDRTWSLLWSPQGQREWIATDGEIRFVGEGLQMLQVTGTSFGLDIGEDEIFAECHACPHRRLTATWTRRGEVYVRQTKLAANAPLAEAIWEMTERKPYAVLYEALRRARRGLPASELVADANVLNQMRDLGLLDKGARLIPEEEKAEGVRFSDTRNGMRYEASVKGGRLQRIERASK